MQLINTTLAKLRRAFIFAFAAALVPQPSGAVEGGLSAYLLGSRDSLAGIVPPPGTYAGLDVIGLSGEISGVSLNGLPIRADTEIDATVVKLSFTHVFDTQLWGGTPALNFNVPILNVSAEFTAILPPIAGSRITDETSGIGDITVTPMVGWHKGNLHYSAGLSVYAPTGNYDTATVSLSPVGADILSNGKNVWSLQPVFAVTHLDPKTGLEFSGAGSVIFTQWNDATNYQTAPAITLEGAALQHLKSGWAFGVTGYWYQQVSDDSGSGADAIKRVLGTDSLQARVYGAGPIITYSGEVFGKNAGLELKYFREFGTKNRFENDVIWLNASISF